MEAFAAKCNKILDLLNNQKVKEAVAEIKSFGEVK